MKIAFLRIMLFFFALIFFTMVSSQSTNSITFANLGPAMGSATISEGIWSKNLMGEEVFYGVSIWGEFLRLYRYNLATEKVDLEVPIPGVAGSRGIVQYGQKLFITTYDPARLYSYDLETANLTQLYQFPNERFVWSTVLSKDTLYMGTYPNASVYSFHIPTQTINNLGRLSQEQYVRTLAVWDGKLYAGIGAKAQLIEFDPSTKTSKNLLPTEFSNDSFVYDVAIESNQLFFALYPSRRIASMDLKTRAFQLRIDDIENAKSLVPDQLSTQSHYFELFGYYMAFDPSSNTLSRLLPNPYQPSVAPEAVNQRYVRAINNDALYYEYNLDGSVRKRIDFLQHGLKAVRVYPFAAFASGGKVYVGERRLKIFEPKSAQENYFAIRGQPEAMCILNNTLISANYPYSRIWQYPLSAIQWDSSANLQDPSYQQLEVKQQQNRPKAMLCLPQYNLALIGTEPQDGEYGGALVALELGSNQTNVWRNLVPNHTISVLAASSDHRVWLGTSVVGGAGTRPLPEAAKLVRWDAVEKKKLLEIAPEANNPAITSIATLGNWVYLCTGLGTLMALDDAGHIQRQNKSTKFEFVIATGGRLYASSGNRLFGVDPNTLEISLVQEFPSPIRILFEDSIQKTVYMVSGFDLWMQK